MKKHLKKWFLSVFLITCLLTACSSAGERESTGAAQSTVKEENSLTEVETVANLFDEEPTTETVKTVVELPDNSDVDGGSVNVETEFIESINKNGVIYDGGELRLPVVFSGSGACAEQVGLVVYVNGIPHAYRVEGVEKRKLREEKTDCDEMKYMHTFRPKSGPEIKCEFCFTPLVGSEGDVLEVCVATLEYPEATSRTETRGSKHSILPVVRRLVYQSTPPEAEPLAVDSEPLVSAIVSKEELTTAKKGDFRNYSSSGSTNVRRWPELLLWIEESVQCGQAEILLGDEDLLNIRLEVIGASMIRYRAIVYVNHEPLNIGDENQLILELQDGMVSVLDVELDVSKMEGMNAFYIVLVPENYWEMREIDVIPEMRKTGTVWFYRED